MLSTRAFTVSLLALALCVPAQLAFAPVAAAQSGGGTATGLQLSGDEPVQVEGDELEVLENEGRAIFTGNVRVVQGETMLRTGKLVIFYARDAEGEENTGSTMTSGVSSIERLEASNGVNIQSESQVATGDEGFYDMKSDTFVLTGDQVTLSEGGNVATGCKLTVTMSTGNARLGGCGQGGQRPTILLQPNSSGGN